MPEKKYAAKSVRIPCLIVCVLCLMTTFGRGEPRPHPDRQLITDCMGRNVRVPIRITKVVDLAMLDGVRTMVELGVADRIVGINDTVRDFMYGAEGKAFDCWFAAPKAAPHLKMLPSVGGCREPNTELIVSLHPDVILAYASSVDFPEALEEQTGIPVVCINASGCLDFKMVELVGKITGQQQRAEELIAYARSKIDSIAQKSAQIPESSRVKVFFWGWPVHSCPRTLAPYDPIHLAGGVNVAMQPGIKPYQTFDITKEQLAVWNPDVIVLQWWTRKNVGVRAENILQDPAFQTIAAVKNNQVFYSRSFMKGWDPAMGVCEVLYLAKLFYPELYRNLDVENESNEILERFYRVSGLYTDLLKHSQIHHWPKRF